MRNYIFILGVFISVFFSKETKGFEVYNPCDFINYILYDIKLHNYASKYLFVCNEYIYKDVHSLYKRVPDSLVKEYDLKNAKSINIIDQGCESFNARLISIDEIRKINIPIELDSIGRKVEKQRDILFNLINNGGVSDQQWQILSGSPEYQWYSRQYNYQIPKFIYFHEMYVIDNNKIIVLLSYNGSANQRDRELTMKMYLFEMDNKHNQNWKVTALDI